MNIISNGIYLFFNSDNLYFKWWWCVLEVISLDVKLPMLLFITIKLLHKHTPLSLEIVVIAD